MTTIEIQIRDRGMFKAVVATGYELLSKQARIVLASPGTPGAVRKAGPAATVSNFVAGIASRQTKRVEEESSEGILLHHVAM